MPLTLYQARIIRKLNWTNVLLNDYHWSRASFSATMTPLTAGKEDTTHKPYERAAREIAIRVARSGVILARLEAASPCI